MSVKDLRSGLKVNNALNAAISSNTTTNGSIIDTADFDKGLMFSVMAQAYTDGTYDFTIEEGDAANLSDAAAVPADKLIGSLANMQLTALSAAGAKLPTIGVHSNKRYVRINAVSTVVTTGATIVAKVTQAAELSPVDGPNA